MPQHRLAGINSAAIGPVGHPLGAANPAKGHKNHMDVNGDADKVCATGSWRATRGDPGRKLPLEQPGAIG
jgi:hypothetical protein